MGVAYENFTAFVNCSAEKLPVKIFFGPLSLNFIHCTRSVINVDSKFQGILVTQPSVTKDMNCLKYFEHKYCFSCYRFIRSIKVHFFKLLMNLNKFSCMSFMPGKL